CASVDPREESREAQASGPGPDRIVAHDGIPRADDCIDAADQVLDRHEADAARGRREPAIRGVVPIVAHHEDLVGSDNKLLRVIELALPAKLEDGMLASV